MWIWLLGCKLMNPALQLDYAQTLATLISLAETYLVGALPANLSAVTGADPSNPAGTATAAGTPAAAVGTGAAPPTPALALTPSVPTLSELAAWTEARAQTTFARREAVRNASRAVSDVLKGVRT
jgi:hypothetical protein